MGKILLTSTNPDPAERIQEFAEQVAKSEWSGFAEAMHVDKLSKAAQEGLHETFRAGALVGVLAGVQIAIQAGAIQNYDKN